VPHIAVPLESYLTRNASVPPTDINGGSVATAPGALYIVEFAAKDPDKMMSPALERLGTIFIHNAKISPAPAITGAILVAHWPTPFESYLTINT